jgi:hypothetical protein
MKSKKVIHDKLINEIKKYDILINEIKKKLYVRKYTFFLKKNICIHNYCHYNNINLDLYIIFYLYYYHNNFFT